MPAIARNAFEPLRDFLKAERSSGVVLLGATVIALLLANGAPKLYEAIWTTPVPIQIGPWAVGSDLRHWISDGAMAIFFFVVGLEIKRELSDGELRAPRQAALPIIAAIGGMVLPALFYFTLTRDSGDAGRGWAIPIATDIAFAVGVLTILGSRVPPGLRVFLLSVAIVDDIGAIAVIALFYASGVHAAWLAGAAVTLIAFRSSWAAPAGVVRSIVLTACALVTWVLVYESGIHATIAGVALAFLVPAGAGEDPSAAERLELGLHPWSALVIVPLFALASAGVELAPATLAAAAQSPIAAGVFIGLVLGKVLGLTFAAFVAIQLRVAAIPLGVSGRHIVGASLLGGIGFTVALFIAQLAFDQPAALASAKIGIFSGSVIAGVAGSLVLRTSRP